MEEVFVSIICLAYNHEDYIRDAIEGFLIQKVNFKYEVIIYDDASTDKTAKIIKEYEDKKPEIVHGIYQNKNQWRKNQPSILWIKDMINQNSKGRYIAFCEGDDYWIDSCKLQLQIDYMEQHPECVLTVHNALDINYKNKEIKARNPFMNDGNLVPEDVIMQYRGHPPTASMIYRKDAVEMTDFFWKVGIVDYPTQLYCLNRGKIYYFSRIMSVYRCFHKGSYGENLIKNEKARFNHNIHLIAFLAQYNQYTNYTYNKYIINRIQGAVDDIIYSHRKLTLHHFQQISKTYDEETNFIYHTYIKNIIRLYSFRFDKNYTDQGLQDFCNNNKKIYIMGAGVFAGIVADKLNSFQIEYQGFVVSNNQEHERKYLGKNVMKLKECKKELETSGLIIGINPTVWSQIIDALEIMDIKNYMCPFLLIT